MKPKTMSTQQKTQKNTFHDAAYDQVIHEMNMQGRQQRVENPVNALKNAHGTYDNFLANLPRVTTPAPPDTPAAKPAPLSYKQRKKLEKEYEQQKKEAKNIDATQLASISDLENLSVYKSNKEKWMNEVLPHSESTRSQTIQQVNNGDYSNFENLDPVLRNLYANKALSEFTTKYENFINTNDARGLCEQLVKDKGGVTGLLDPAVRLGLSLYQNIKTPTLAQKRLQSFFLSLDETMSTMVMEATLTHVTDKESFTEHLHASGIRNARGEASDAIKANKAQQIQIAKRLLLMQLSNFSKVNDDDTAEPWDKSMAVALSHCSRVALTLPKVEKEVSKNSKDAHAFMMQSIFYMRNGDNTAQYNQRTSSTHSIKRRKVKGSTGTGSKEKKVWFNLIGQYGMNCAIGGLGNAGISGKMLSNDGSCGHFYSMCKEADEEHYGTILMGLESDAAGKINQMGHKHTAAARGEYASSLGGQRTDEIGKKYSGRQCDLSHLSAGEISTWMIALEEAMVRWQSSTAGMGGQDAKAAMRLLAGNKMNQEQWNNFKSLIGLPDTF